jgi:raffinose/stachyose/melibiose transport system substrate-binding protein
VGGKLPAGLKGVAQYQSKTYNAIFGVNGIGAVYNQDALTKAGLTPPNTYTELLAFCKAAAAKGTPAFALGNQDNWVTQLILYALVATTVYSNDRGFDTKMQDGVATFANSPWTTAMSKYLEMNQSGCFQQNPLGTNYEATQDLAATGKTLGLVQGNWVIALLKNKNPSGTFILKPLPATDDTNAQFMPAAAGAGLRRQRQDEEQGTRPEVRQLRHVARGHDGVQQEAGQPAVPARTPATPSTRR